MVKMQQHMGVSCGEIESGTTVHGCVATGPGSADVLTRPPKHEPGQLVINDVSTTRIAYFTRARPLRQRRRGLAWAQL